MRKVRIRKTDGKYYVEYWQRRWLFFGYWCPYITYFGTGEAYPFSTLDIAKFEATRMFAELIKVVEA